MLDIAHEMLDCKIRRKCYHNVIIVIIINIIIRV